MRTTSYLALSRQAALERQMATDREQPRQRHAPRAIAPSTWCSRRRCIGPAAGGSPSSRTWPCARPGARADRADRQSARSRDRRRRLPRLRDRWRDALWAGRAARDRPGRPAGEFATGEPLLDDGGNADPPGRGRDGASRSPATARSSGGNGPIARDRRLRLRQRAGAAPGRRRAVHRERAGDAGRAARAWSRVRSKAPTSSRSWR